MANIDGNEVVKMNTCDTVNEDIKNEKSEWLPKDKEDLPPPSDTFGSKFTSCRWAIAYLSAVASILLITLRHCLSMAIVCMEVNISDARDGKYSNISWKILQNISSETSYNTDRPFNVTNVTNNVVTFSKINPYFGREYEGLLLSSYYYGYVMTPFFGGFMAARFGPKVMIGLSIATCSVLTVLMPVAFRFNFYLAVAFRVALGLASGVVLPSQQVLWSHWAPVNERAQLAAFTNSGVNIGSIIVTVVSAMLCGIPLDYGWPFIFYVYGGVGMLWLAVWMAVVYDSPEGHPRITEKEKQVIYYRKTTRTTSVKPPWKKILKSPPFWALMCLHISEAWVLTSITTYIPLYMNDVLKFSIKENGSLSSLPFIGRFIGGILAAFLADWLLVKEYMSTTVIRKLFQTIGSVLPASMLIGVSFLTADQRMGAVALLTLTMTSHSATMASFRANYFDIAPRYSGQIMGVTLTVAILGNIVNPLLTSSITIDKTQEQWRTVFCIAAGIMLTADIIFLVFGSGQEQEWSIQKSKDMVLVVEETETPNEKPEKQ